MNFPDDIDNNKFQIIQTRHLIPRLFYDLQTKVNKTQKRSIEIILNSALLMSCIYDNT